MYVAKVKLENIRGFHDARKVDLDLSRPDGSYAGWTVVTGPTGSGRSTFLRAIALAIGGPAEAPALAGEAQTWVAQGKSRGGVEVDLVTGGDDQFARGFTPPEGENVFADLVFAEGGIAMESNVGRNGPWQENPSGWFCAAYGPYRRLTTRQGPKGKLAGLFEPELAVFPQAVPLALRDKALALVNDGLVPSEFTARWEGDELWIGASPIRALGDGYKSLVALALDLLRLMGGEETREGVVLIDEIEAHLQLNWQQWVGGWLTRHFPRLQFIVSTNSPYVCQAADPRGLILLPGADEELPAEVIEGDLYERVIHGSAEDVALSELFGLDSSYPPRARRLRQELVELEIKVLDGQADEVQRARYAELQELLVSSPAARASEIAARLQRDKARRGRP